MNLSCSVRPCYVNLPAGVGLYCSYTTALDFVLKSRSAEAGTKLA